MARPEGITTSQPFKLTVEGFNRPQQNAANGAANAPRQLANAQAVPNAPQPIVAQARHRMGFFTWLASKLGFASSAPAPVPRVVPESVHATFNAGIVTNIADGRLDRLPADIQAGLSNLVSRLRDIFGAAAVPVDETIDQIVNASNVTKDLGSLRNAANEQGRDLTAAEVVGVYTEKSLERLSYNTIGAFILAKVNARGSDISVTAKAIGAQFELRHPGLLTELRNCRNPDEIAAAVQRHEAEIEAFVDIVVRSNAANQSVESKAAAKLAAALGIDTRLVVAHIPTDELCTEAKELSSAIMHGDAPGCKEPGYDVEAAYDALVDKFVQKRVDAYAAIDSLDLPEYVKNHWKAEYISTRSVPKLTPAQLFEVAKSIDPRQLEGALSKGLPLKLAVEMLHNATKTIDDAICKESGNPNFFDGMGVDDTMPLYGMLIAFAEAKNPALTQAIRNVNETFSTPVDEYCKSNAFESTAVFVETLAVRGGSVKDVPLTNEAKYLAIVEADAEAALTECGVTDAQVRKDVKDVMLKQGRDALARATGLNALSGFLGTVKTSAVELAKALDALVKCRSVALNVAATTISVSTGLGKAYVLNNLDMHGIASSSGKLRLLYLDIKEKARKGEAFDTVVVMNKANDIVSKFAFSKIAILKEIDKTGFPPAERAAHKARALRDPDWSDPDVVTVAKNLADHATMKKAMRMLAGMLKSETASTLDDSQLRDAFLIFGKACVTTLETEFKAYAERWSGSVDTRRLLQRMTLQLLAKEEPGFAASLAQLAASGRIDRLQTQFSDGMSKAHSLKMDYETLRQYNLMGAPAGEMIRSGLVNPNLKYDEAGFRKSVEDEVLYIITGSFVGIMTEDFPGKGAFNVDRYIALKTKGVEVVAKYADGLTQEAVPLLAKLVDALDWCGNAAARSEEIVKNYVEDMKTWRDIVPGSSDAAGLEKVFTRRMNEYLKDVLSGQAHAAFNTDSHPGLFQTFLDDLPRCKYTINGKKIPGEKLNEKIVPFMDAIKDPMKRKVVSVMINQQIYGDFTSSIGNRIPFDGWKDGMPEEPVGSIPGIEKFASRDIAKTGYGLFDTGPMEFEIAVSPDEKTVRVHAKSVYPLHVDVTLPKETIGTCTVTQDFTIDFSGAEPVIKDFKIGQMFA